MNKKLEEQILEEIKKRVLEKDKELSAKEEQLSIHNATLEALSEMTALSKTDVNKIADDVKKEMLKRKSRTQKYITWAAAIAGLLFVIFFRQIFPKKAKVEIVLEENFDNATRGWNTSSDFKYKRYFEAGNYIFETGVNDWCYWDYIQIPQTTRYTVELTSTWKEGKFDEYGLILLETNKKYCVFQLRADGAVSFAKKIEGTWVVNSNWTKNMARNGDGIITNTQKIQVDNGSIMYFVNNNFVKEASIRDLNINMAGIRVCDKQKVAFSQMSITDDNTGEVVLEENFDNADKGWEPDMDMEKEQLFADGEYVFVSNKEDHCFWSSVPTSFTDETNITLTCTWKKGEQSNYGLMVMQDDDSYFACEMRNDGSGRLVACENGEYTNIPDYIKTQYKSDGLVSYNQRIKIKNKILSYYINEQLIGTASLDYMYLNEVGVRVCGHQTVAFDKLIVENIKY